MACGHFSVILHPCASKGNGDHSLKPSAALHWPHMMARVCSAALDKGSIKWITVIFSQGTKGTTTLLKQLTAL